MDYWLYERQGEIMKKTLIFVVCLFALTGCGSNNTASNLPPANSSKPATTSQTESELSNEEMSSIDNKNSEAVPSSEPVQKGAVVEIKEKMFIAQTNDIYFNSEDYLGKTIKYEGIFNIYEVPDTEEKYYSVIRYGPGCCGTDGNAGFEVIWDKEYPNNDDWVEAVGVLEEYDYNGMKYLRISLTSLTVKTERGAEYVAQ